MNHNPGHCDLLCFQISRLPLSLFSLFLCAPLFFLSLLSPSLSVLISSFFLSFFLSSCLFFLFLCAHLFFLSFFLPVFSPSFSVLLSISVGLLMLLPAVSVSALSMRAPSCQIDTGIH